MHNTFLAVSFLTLSTDWVDNFPENWVDIKLVDDFMLALVQKTAKLVHLLWIICTLFTNLLAFPCIFFQRILFIRIGNRINQECTNGDYSTSFTKAVYEMFIENFLFRIVAFRLSQEMVVRRFLYLHTSHLEWLIGLKKKLLSKG